MTRKLVQGFLMAAALVVPSGNALAFCMEGDTMECMCPDGSWSLRYCINSRFGACECGGLREEDEGASVSKAEVAARQSPSEAEAALSCVDASKPEQAPAPASTRG
ncbi:hypothetical protein HPC49_42150 [Pyxidicoccus fallax]|uniref:Lipoprotein n=1 Tax=Pyxidicoccus fallax TaxID=394095 RepID=A0A848LHB3_9BACT|nr:hypothetical protein [Pyxidicoccus fallax]NMO17125.1 hypothetical protein [Pyxidicoccus fallax]NPC84808.1 hypothetical protein [Pyxidicoccus fallax]